MPTSAVIGGGISGLTAAYVLSRTGPVTLFEADERFGGHAHTHTVAMSEGARRVDSGFIVFNDRTYPMLGRLFAELEVESQPSDMSLSIGCDGCGLEYSGGQGAKGLFAQPRRLLSPRHYRLLAEIPRFHREARKVLAQTDDVPLTWGDFLRTRRFSPDFIAHFAVPFVSCVWSCDSANADRYPAIHLFRFLEHHGMLAIGQSPTWRTVVDGSGTYVSRLVSRLPGARCSARVLAVTRHVDGVTVATAEGDTTFDQVVIATHADDAARILTDASPAERADLEAIGYSENPTWLHRDTTVLPKARHARAAWNFRLHSCDPKDANVLVSYWMNRLQQLESNDDVMVTLNPSGWVDRSKIVAEMTYRHPVFTTEAVAAAARLRTAGGPRLAFAGAHLGFGFHEDGCRSGVEAAARLGATW